MTEEERAPEDLTASGAQAAADVAEASADSAAPSWSPEAPAAEREAAEPMLETSAIAGDGTPPLDAPSPAGVRAAEASTAGDGTEAKLRARVAELERKVEAERDAATDYMQRWQRAQADFANYKRRAQQEQQQRETLVAAQVVASMLPALDSFERAFATLPQTLRGYSWLDGIALIHGQLHRALVAHGIQPIEVEAGADFDPMRHESIGEVETEAHPAGHIAVLVQRGYEANGVLLRPALVQLARTPQPTQPTEEAEAERKEADQ
jgi:molecular chaperone GrpE